MAERRPTRTAPRRRVLAQLGAAGLAGIAGCGRLAGNRSPEPTATTHGGSPSTPTGSPEPGSSDGTTAEAEAWDVDPVDSDLLVGAYYYAWYRPDQPWLERSPSSPVLGEYSSRDDEVINQHVKWALESGIDTFIYRWGGPDAWDDATIREHVLEAALGDQIDFAIQPSIGSLSADPDYAFPAPIDFDDRATRENLTDVFEYLGRTFFDRPNYARLDGRPVVTLFGGTAFAGDYGSAIEEATTSIETPYVVADMAFLLASGWADDADFAGVDAVTTYTLYDPEKAAALDFDEYERYVEEQGLTWRLGAANRGVGFVPDVGPGYDDSLARPDKEGPPIEPTPDRFVRFIRGQRDYVDPELDAIFVTSFNEWYEDTSVEPREADGAEYLRTIEDELATAPIEPVDVDAEFVKLRIAFNTTVESKAGDRDLALMVTRLELRDAGGHTTVAYDIGVPADEPHIVEGGYPPEEDPESAAGSWRWFGGPTAEAVMYLGADAGDASRLALRGTPMVDDDIGASVYFDGRHAGDVDFGQRGVPEWFTVPLPPT